MNRALDNFLSIYVGEIMSCMNFNIMVANTCTSEPYSNSSCKWFDLKAIKLSKFYIGSLTNSTLAVFATL